MTNTTTEDKDRAEFEAWLKSRHITLHGNGSDITFEAFQFAKESSRKELESAKQRIAAEEESHAQLQARCYDQGGGNVFDECATLKAEKEALENELESANQRIAELSQKVTLLNGVFSREEELQSYLTESQAAKEALEMKLAALLSACVKVDFNLEYQMDGVVAAWHSAISGSTEELTKQAGRDEVMRLAGAGSLGV